MKNATREMILGFNDIKLEKLEVPQWDMVVYIKQMSGKDADKYVFGLEANEGLKKSLTLIIQCVCKEDGSRMFKDEDIEALYDKNSATLNWLLEKILEINLKKNDDLEIEAKN